MARKPQSRSRSTGSKAGRTPRSRVGEGYLVTFLNDLPDAGPSGFEGLVGVVLEAATGQRFFVAGSGSQGGMDLASEAGLGNRIKAEAKNYRKSSLDLRELTAEIAQAARAPDLDLWVLAATCPLKAQHAIELEAEAAERGVECLFLDRPKAGLSRLEVLMAAHPEVVEGFARAHGMAFDAAALRAALSKVAAAPGFQAAKAQVHEKLNGTLLGYEDARRRMAAFLRRTLADSGSSHAAFNQRLGINDPASRKVDRSAVLASLDAWWREHACAGGHGVALGEGGMGKSWVVFDWIARRLVAGDFPLVVPVVASAAAIGDGDTIDTLLPRALRDCLGLVDAARWAARLRRWLSARPESSPLVVAVVDGLNEKPSAKWAEFFRSLRHEDRRGRVTVLATDRPGHWTPECRTLEPEGFAPVPVGRYDGAELEQALSGKGVGIEGIPDGPLRDMVRTPLYCDLVCEHLPEMERQGDYTVERLIFLDVSRRKSSKPGHPLTPDDFAAIVARAAERYRTGPERLSADDVARLSPVPGHSREIYTELTTGGFLVRTPGAVPAWRVERTRLVYGLGMLLADDAREGAERGEDAPALRERIASWLEPHPEMDLKVDALGSALFHAYLDEDFPADARLEVLAAWLGARNRSAPSQAAFAGYILRHPEDFVTAADRVWTYAGNNGNAQDFLARALLAHRDDPRVRPALAEALYRWMGVVHPSGPPLLRHGEAATARMRADIEARVRHPLRPGPLDILGERLTVVGDEGHLRLRRLGFLVLSAGERAPFARCLVAWAVAAAVDGTAIEADVADWVVRLAEAHDPLAAALLPEARRLLGLGELGRSAGHILLRRIGNAEANDLAALHPLPESAEAVRRRAEHAANPCASIYAWSEEQRRVCMERPDTSLHTILQRSKPDVFDPGWPVPAIVTERAAAALRGIPEAEVNGRFAATMETSRFEDLLPVLATRAPGALAAYLRGLVRTAPERNLEGQRQLSFWLRELSPLLGADEVAAIARVLDALRDDAGGWREPDGVREDNSAQLAEAFFVLGLLPRLESDRRWDEVLARPEAALDLQDFGLWFERVSRDRAQEGLRVVHRASEGTGVARVLWMLPSAGVKLSPDDRERLVELARAAAWLPRALVLRHACLTDDEELGRRVVELGHAYRDAAPAWEMEWGARAVLRFSGHLAFEDAAARLHPATAGRLLLARGRRPDEAELYARSIDEGLRVAVEAEEPAVGAPPSVRVPAPGEALGNDYPSLEPDTPETVVVRSADSTWGSADDEAPPLGRVLRPPSKDDFERRGMRRREKLETLLAAWKTGALGWFGRSFAPESLAAAAGSDPRRIRGWAAYALRDGPRGRSARLRLGSFFAALSEAAFVHEPATGLGLWRRLRSDDHNPARVDLDALPFRAPAGPECDEARREVLEGCRDDDALSRLAVAAQSSGAGGWLLDTVQELVNAPPLWRRALGLALAGLSDLPAAAFEAHVEAADVQRTWVENLVPKFRADNRRNIWARVWYERFLSEQDPDVWWSSLQAFMRCGDARFAVWRGCAERRPVAERSCKVAYAATNRERLRRALDRSGEREATFLGMRTHRGEVFPFHG